MSLKGIKQLGLLVLDTVGGISNKRTYANWLDARVEMIGNSSIGYVENKGKSIYLHPKVPPFRELIHLNFLGFVLEIHFYIISPHLEVNR